MKKLCFLLVALTGLSGVHAQTAGNSEPLFIVFPGDSADLKAVGTELAIQNHQTFIKIAQILVDNPQYRILIDGHANPVQGGREEEAGTLRPLSERRASAAADFLVNYYKVDRKRLILTGAGGGYPFGDNNQARNRRVSFFIITPR
ncbi:MAG: OmpA family protein [Spirochaetaceae bacterium]|nr:OmpA family protein [Spirochaetaceae bacterium]